MSRYGLSQNITLVNEKPHTHDNKFMEYKTNL